jgi:hypothetical protein
MSEHTPTPWVYRPHEHDDWGWIRGPKEGDFTGPIVAISRSNKNETSDSFDAHRAAGTDPYEANAAFIIKAVNNHDDIVRALQSIAGIADNLQGRIAKEALLGILASVGNARDPK